MAEWLKRLGIALPLIQAPMAGSQGCALAVAVARAGGLGSLPGALLTPAGLAQELAQVAQGLGGAAAEARRGAPGTAGLAVNVNFFCHRMPPQEPARLQAWRAALAPYAALWGVEPAGVEGGAGGAVRQPFDSSLAEVLELWRPAVVSFHFGLPEPGLLERLRAWGAVVISSATTVAEARWLEAQGVDAVIAQGLEAGGHRGMFLSEDLNSQSGTLALVPRVAQAVSVPVVAAGGIGDAAGVRAALALGASAVQVGTAFLGCPEATTSAVHRQALSRAAGDQGLWPQQASGTSGASGVSGVSGPSAPAQASPSATALTRLFSGRPARGLVNRLMRELGPLNPVAPAFPLASQALQPIRQKAEAAGCDDFSPLWCGQYPPRWMGRPAADVVAELMQDHLSPASGRCAASTQEETPHE